MLTLGFASATSFIVTLLLLPFIIRFSRKKKLLVVPGKRRIHKRITPSLGGAAIFLGFAIASIIWIDISRWSGSFLLVTILVIPFVIGLFDDLTHLKPSIKLIAQFLTATIIFFSLDVRLTSMYGLFTNASFPITVSYPLTLITIIVVTNAFNLIDGIDGLAGAFALISLLFMGIWFYMADDVSYAILCFAFIGGIFAFLLKNWEPSKIFMGDTGSLVIGTALSVFVIQFMNDNVQLPSDSPIRFQSSIGAAFCILIIPLVDTLRIIIIRLSKKVSPFKADKRHIHHVLIRIGLSHGQAVSLLSAIHLFLLAMCVAFRKYSDIYIVGFVVVLSIVLCLLLDRLFFRHAFTDPKPRSGSGLSHLQ